MALKNKIKQPIDEVIEIEERRVRLGLKKQDICAKAKIKPEMYSYLLARGRKGMSLPSDCLEAIRTAITKLEGKTA